MEGGSRVRLSALIELYIGWSYVQAMWPERGNCRGPDRHIQKL